MPLSCEQIEHFRAEGYAVLPAALPTDRTARYIALLDALVARSARMTVSAEGFHLAPDASGHPVPGRLHKVQGVCVVEPRLLALACEPAILDAVQTLLGPELEVFGTKFFPMREPGATSTGWHQDNFYFGTRTDRIVSCAIYLHGADPDNGCLRVLPGSHRSGEIVPHVAGQGVYAHGAWSEVDESQAVDIVCPPGTAVLFSANLLHGARPNRSGRASYRTAWHYLPAGLPLDWFPQGVYEDRHLLRSLEKEAAL